MIELKEVCKNYGLTKALIDVSFKVEKGEIIGFVGPNGAGKSTAMRIITTYTAPTSGTIKVGQYDVLENPLEVRQMIGYLPETVPLYYDMVVYDYLEFMGSARHLNGRLRSRMDWVTEACQIETVLHRPIGVLSKGFKQRVCLAQALLHDPDVLILDEPTSGLDPLQIIGIRNLVKELAHEKTIMVSTHILQEVSSIADRIIVINDGRIVADGSFHELQSQIEHENIFYLAVKAEHEKVESKVKSLSGIENVEVLTSDESDLTQLRIHYVDDNLPESLDKLIKKEKWTLVEYRKEKLSLEDTFLKLTKATKEKVTERVVDKETEAD